MRSASRIERSTPYCPTMEIFQRLNFKNSGVLFALFVACLVHYPIEQTILGTTLKAISVMQKSWDTEKSMSESANLMHTTVYAALFGACGLYFSKSSRSAQIEMTKVTFWSVQTFEITGIPNKGRDRKGLKSALRAFLIIIRIVSATHATSSDDIQLDQPWLFRKKWLRGFF